MLVVCPRRAAFCCISTFSLGPALWWSAAARAVAIDCCSCLSMARSRRPRRRWATHSCPLAIISSTSDTKKEGTLARKGCVVVVVVVVVVARLFVSCSWQTSVLVRSGATPLPQPSRLPPSHAATWNGGVALSGGGHFLCRRLLRVQHPLSTARINTKATQKATQPV